MAKKRKTALQIFQDKLRFLQQAENRLITNVTKHQKELLELILTEYVPLFDLNDGTILNNAKNIALIQKLDKVFDKLEKNLFRDVLGVMVQDLLAATQLNGKYYIGLGFKKSVIDEILKDKINLETKLGITPTGRLRTDSYLYRLGKTGEVRNKLKDYVIKNLTGDTAFADFQLGFRNLVIGNKKQKGLATTGALQQYFDQYATDSFAQFDAVTDKQFANELGLTHFIYEGSLIPTSRKFCEKRAGKAFTVKETKNWKNDPDLIDKKTKDSYVPLVERGRYRCRHSIRYITEPLYKELTK